MIDGCAYIISYTVVKKRKDYSLNEPSSYCDRSKKERKVFITHRTIKLIHRIFSLF